MRVRTVSQPGSAVQREQRARQEEHREQQHLHDHLKAFHPFDVAGDEHAEGRQGDRHQQLEADDLDHQHDG